LTFACRYLFLPRKAESYHTVSGYVQQPNVFTSAIVTGTLTAPGNTPTSPNGLIGYGSPSLFPQKAADGANFFADVLFLPNPTPGSTPSSSAHTASHPSLGTSTTVTPGAASSPVPVTVATSPYLPAGTVPSASVPSVSAPSVSAPSSGANAATGSLFEPPAGQAYLGVSTDFGRLDTFDKAAGITTPAIFNQWTTPDGPFAPTLANAASRPGLTPMVSWNLPFDGAQVTNGSEDAYINAQAAAVRSYGKPVFIRLDWEMNGFWYPHWNLGAVTPAEYVASWRHVYALFHAAGVGNAAFVWAPNALDYFSTSGQRVTTASWYPGDDVVNWIGLDAYPQSTPDDTILTGQDGMNDMAAFSSAHGKPLMLAEWAPNTPHPDVADPVNLVFDWAETHSNVKALVYFDFITQGKDFTLVDHPVGASTFRGRVQGNSRYLLAGAIS
jgi:hypothetical protein